MFDQYDIPAVDTDDEELLGSLQTKVGAREPTLTISQTADDRTL